MTDWQHIDTAPKDGTVILIATDMHAHPGWYDARDKRYPWRIVEGPIPWSTERDGESDNSGLNAWMGGVPRYWQPIPDAPGGE